MKNNNETVILGYLDAKTAVYDFVLSNLKRSSLCKKRQNMNQENNTIFFFQESFDIPQERFLLQISTIFSIKITVSGCL